MFFLRLQVHVGQPYLSVTKPLGQYRWQSNGRHNDTSIWRVHRVQEYISYISLCSQFISTACLICLLVFKTCELFVELIIKFQIVFEILGKEKPWIFSKVFCQSWKIPRTFTRILNFLIGFLLQKWWINYISWIALLLGENLVLGHHLKNLILIAQWYENKSFYEWIKRYIVNELAETVMHAKSMWGVFVQLKNKQTMEIFIN